jgi:ABC-type Na+ efflux pump permease subunit
VSISSIATVTRREANEIFSDWRIVLPIGLLTFLLPLIMANAAVFAIDFVEDEQLANGLLPFSLMLVGFLPAGFSIITALESFVGERERNTLESLLSTPLSDRDLYLSKLCSSLLMPLLSSTIAMGIFTSILYRAC